MTLEPLKMTKNQPKTDQKLAKPETTPKTYYVLVTLMTLEKVLKIANRDQKKLA